MPNLPEKTCVACGRSFAWRKKWARNWDEVRYCSDACRRDGKRAGGDDLEQAILLRLKQIKRDGSICPSEIARQVGDENSWREWMEPVRRAARRLVARGALQITQGGRVVDPSRVRGPIRLRLPR